MDSEQIRLLSLLAKKQKGEKRTNQEILNSFVSAGILTVKGNYTKKINVLKKAGKSFKAE